MEQEKNFCCRWWLYPPGVPWETWASFQRSRANIVPKEGSGQAEAIPELTTFNKSQPKRARDRWVNAVTLSLAGTVL